jgi:UDPglucose 6-dehydrogenase
MNPEFVLLGADSFAAKEVTKKFYSTLHKKPVFETTVENAELIKVIYNTYISSKISVANTIMEICHKTPNTNCDDVVDALSLATERLISNRYMRGGMGDGGGCHPRDNIALSWLSKKLNLSYDWFENIMVCREEQTEWLAELVEEKQKETGLPVMILGKSFKEESNIEVGSPAILLKNILNEKGIQVEMYDPHIDGNKLSLQKPMLYFIGTKHKVFREYSFSRGSVVIDPWRYIVDQKGVEVIRIGE